MKLGNKYETEDFRWVAKDGTRVSWRQTVKSACAYFGTFGGRWHNNHFWKSLAEKEPSMTDAECERAVREWEQRADEALAQWQMYQ